MQQYANNSFCFSFCCKCHFHCLVDIEIVLHCHLRQLYAEHSIRCYLLFECQICNSLTASDRDLNVPHKQRYANNSNRLLFCCKHRFRVLKDIEIGLNHHFEQRNEARSIHHYLSFEYQSCDFLEAPYKYPNAH